MVFDLACRTPFKFIGLLLTPSMAERRSQLDLVGALMCILESGSDLSKLTSVFVFSELS